jgi:hypothetical protein
MLDNGDPTVKRRLVTIAPKELIGRTFLKDTAEDGQRFRARVIQAFVKKEEGLKKGPEYMRFICEGPNSNVHEILTCNEVLYHIEKDNIDIKNDTEQLYKFRQKTMHQGPL